MALVEELFSATDGTAAGARGGGAGIAGAAAAGGGGAGIAGTGGDGGGITGPAGGGGTTTPGAADGKRMCDEVTLSQAAKDRSWWFIRQGLVTSTRAKGVGGSLFPH